MAHANIYAKGNDVSRLEELLKTAAKKSGTLVSIAHMAKCYSSFDGNASEFSPATKPTVVILVELSTQDILMAKDESKTALSKEHFGEGKRLNDICFLRSLSQQKGRNKAFDIIALSSISL